MTRSLLVLALLAGVLVGIGAESVIENVAERIHIPKTYQEGPWPPSHSR